MAQAQQSNPGQSSDEGQPPDQSLENGEEEVMVYPVTT